MDLSAREGNLTSELQNQYEVLKGLQTKEELEQFAIGLADKFRGKGLSEPHYLKFVNEVRRSPDLESLQFYLTNYILKGSGLGIMKDDAEKIASLVDEEVSVNVFLSSPQMRLIHLVESYGYKVGLLEGLPDYGPQAMLVDGQPQQDASPEADPAQTESLDYGPRAKLVDGQSQQSAPAPETTESAQAVDYGPQAKLMEEGPLEAGDMAPEPQQPVPALETEPEEPEPAVQTDPQSMDPNPLGPVPTEQGMMEFAKLVFGHQMVPEFMDLFLRIGASPAEIQAVLDRYKPDVQA